MASHVNPPDDPQKSEGLAEAILSRMSQFEQEKSLEGQVEFI